MRIKLYYAEPYSWAIGLRVERGWWVAVAQDITQKYSDSEMTNHIHMEVRVNGHLVDPLSLAG